MLGVTGAAAYQADIIIVVALRGAEAAAQYSIVMRVFMIGPLLAGFFLTPLWAAFADAFARDDQLWVRHALRRAVVMTGLVNAVWVGISLLTVGPLIRLWSDSELDRVPTSLVLGFSAWAMMSTLSGPLAVLLNAAHVVRAQVFGSIAMAVTNVSVSIVLTHSMGVAGPVWGSVAAQGLVMLPVTGWAAARLLGRLRGAPPAAVELL